MKVLILCGGNGLRIKGNFHNVPKPLIPIHGKPLLSYIIEIYKKHSFNDFVLLIGKNKSKFVDFALSNKDVNITVLQTGLNTPTGGRILKSKHLIDSQSFFVTYGDGISNVDLTALLEFHNTHKLTASLTAVKPQLPFGLLTTDNKNRVTAFHEKPVLDNFINGGFFVLNSEIFEILNEKSDFENEILPILSVKRQLGAFSHNGFWKNMDTYKDYVALEEMQLKKILYL